MRRLTDRMTAGVSALTTALVLTACVSTQTVGSTDETATVAPGTTGPAEGSDTPGEWPTARAANFIHRPGGAVFGVPIDFPTRCSVAAVPW